MRWLTEASILMCVMRLLIITQAVDRNDPTLGFFHRWIEEFAKQCERVTVMCLYEGTHALPQNVRVRVQYLYRFFKYIWRYRHEYDAIFVHMNQIYILLGGFLWRFWGKRIVLWYAHGSVLWSLRLAEKIVHAALTPSRESFRITSKKIHIVGHGIDTDFFTPDPTLLRRSALLSVGRLSVSKRHDLAIRAAALAGRELRIAGAGAERNALGVLAGSLGARVAFLGGLGREQLRDEYRRAAVLVHTSETGSLDKVVLEALSCGTPVVTTSRALGDVPAVVVDATSAALARALRKPPAPDVAYVKYVRRAHALSALIPRILSVLVAPQTVLVAAGVYPPEIGGPATYAAMLEAELPKRGWRIRVLPFAEVRHLPKVLRHLVYFLKCVARVLLREGSLRSTLALFALDPISVGLPALFAARLLRKDFFLRLGGDYAWEQGRLRFGVTASLEEFARGAGWHYPSTVRLFRFTQSFVARRARRISVQSAQMKKVVARWGVPEERIVIIPNGFDAPRDIPDKQSARATLGLCGSVAVSAGRLVPWKGFDGLISVVPEILTHVPDFYLYIIGDGPEERSLRRMAAERAPPVGGAERVIFTGRLDTADLMRYLAGADVFVLNSEYEGFSHQLLEAYAAGAPVVATDIPGNKGVVEHGASGLLVPTGDEAALAEAVSHVLTDTTLAERLTDGGKQKLREFSVKRVAVATDEFLS